MTGTGRTEGDSVKIKLRVASQQRDLIDRAARAMGKTRTEFMLEAAYRAAEEIVSPDVASQALT
jgi:uncharacterized protein (DUF1778 family)